jgi:hypothetical protein
MQFEPMSARVVSRLGGRTHRRRRAARCRGAHAAHAPECRQTGGMVTAGWASDLAGGSCCRAACVLGSVVGTGRVMHEARAARRLDVGQPLGVPCSQEQRRPDGPLLPEPGGVVASAPLHAARARKHDRVTAQGEALRSAAVGRPDRPVHNVVDERASA